MIWLARVPAQFTPRQSLLIVAVAVGLLVAVLLAVLFESVLGGVVSLVLRLTGHRPPRKSAFSSVLDDFEERLKRDEHRDR
ncbi:MAG TPA: hypothetical protein VIC57_09275 [Candidatus Dormibacteraeota bacterium]|jgi:hypothetical protein